MKKQQETDTIRAHATAGKKCMDAHCPIHSPFTSRGRTFVGIVVSDKAQRTATVEWEGKRYVPKYERYTKTRTRVAAHNPECIDAREGDIVRISECRPVSKMKKFVITEKIGTDILFAEKAARMEEAAGGRNAEKELQKKPSTQQESAEDTPE